MQLVIFDGTGYHQRGAATGGFPTPESYCLQRPRNTRAAADTDDEEDVVPVTIRCGAWAPRQVKVTHLTR
jgi:hypothetical protein